MVPETTMVVTLGEVARGLERVEAGQKAVLEKLEASDERYVTRREFSAHVKAFEGFKRDLEGRRIPWTSLAAVLIAGASLAVTIFG